MAGMLGFFGIDHGKNRTEQVLASINPLGTDSGGILDLDGGFMAASAHGNSPVPGLRHYENEEFAGCFSGDIVDVPEIPWERIFDSIGKDRLENFPEFAGCFGIAVCDKKNHRLYLIGDLFGYHPVYYTTDGNAVAFSTSVGTFPRFSSPPRMNISWLYEYLYFSFAVRRTTMWQNVERILPATIIAYDLQNRKFTQHRYGRFYVKADKLLEGDEAAERALEVFSDRIPRYYAGADRFAHALTAGYDTRTVLAFVPLDRLDRLQTYTYGKEGSGDLLEAHLVASSISRNHREIYFNDDYVQMLPELIYETVYLAGGLENICRAYLPFVYRLLTGGGRELPLITSGIGADAIFRGHVPTPNGLSYDMEKAYLTGTKVINREFFSRVFGRHYDDFHGHIDYAVDDMIEAYGGFDSVQGYFTYEIYDGLPRYFNGEAFIASNFTAFRMPLLDPEIIQLACDIEYSVFKLWRFINDDYFKETFLQPYLMASNPILAKVPLQGLPLKAYTSRSKALYNWYRYSRKGPRKLLSLLKSSPKPHLEDWDLWLRTVLKGELDRLLSRDAIVAEYISEDFIDDIRSRNDIHWIKLVASAEAALQMASRGWKLP
jgi:asparagine synthetase B (glutamine-hydrolysing)